MKVLRIIRRVGRGQLCQGPEMPPHAVPQRGSCDQSIARCPSHTAEPRLGLRVAIAKGIDGIVSPPLNGIGRAQRRVRLPL